MVCRHSIVIVMLFLVGYVCVTWDGHDVHIVIANSRVAWWVFSNETQIGTFDNAQTTHGLHMRLAVFDTDIGTTH